MIQLNMISVASPCRASWAGMAGNEKKRHCLECRKDVYNLSAMSSEEAQALLDDSRGRICVRFYRRNDGTILTQDCPVGLRAVRRRVVRVFSCAFTALMCSIPGFARPSVGAPSTQSGYSSSADSAPDPTIDPQTTIGDPDPTMGDLAPLSNPPGDDPALPAIGIPTPPVPQSALSQARTRRIRANYTHFQRKHEHRKTGSGSRS